MTVSLINSSSLVRESTLFIIYEPTFISAQSCGCKELTPSCERGQQRMSKFWLHTVQSVNFAQSQAIPTRATAPLFSTGCTSADFGSKKWMVPLVHRFGDRKTAQVFYFLFQNITDVHSHQNNTTQLMCSRPPTHGLSLKVFFVIASIYK